MGKTYLLEIKADGDKLTRCEREFFDNWRGGKTAVVRTVDEALKVLGAID